MATMKTLNGYGFNATELNGKTSDNYLQKTDTASDTSKLGGKAPEYYIQPRNLLDNSDFRKPVNQRGQTDYTSNGYTIDRWELYSGAVGVSSLGYITTSGQMYQKIAIPTDKVYTFAIENDAGIAVVTGIPANGIHSATLGNALIKLATIGEYVEVVIEPSEGYNIACAYWAALYEGSYTADTLPPYVPKGYAAELAECQRYFWRCNNTWFAEGAGCAFSDTEFRASIVLPQIMRVTPTMVSSTGDTTSYGIKIRTSGKASIAPNAVTLALKNNRIALTLTGTFTNGELGVLRLENDYLDFSADL